MIIQFNNKPDIVSIIANHVVLRKAGKNFSGLCPFHDEKTPSFIVFPNRQRFKCFGCGEGGDVINFTKKIMNTDFKGALLCLGMSKEQYCEQNSIVKKEHELVKKFKKWEQDYFAEISDLYRTTNKLKSKATSQQDVELLSNLYKQESLWEYHMDILTFGNDADKFELYKEIIKNGHKYRSTI